MDMNGKMPLLTASTITTGDVWWLMMMTLYIETFKREWSRVSEKRMRKKYTSERQ